MKSITKKLLCTVLMAISMNEVTFAASLTDFDKSQSSDEHIVWQRAPIDITLSVGRERFISFPSEVQFGYDSQRLPSSVLRVENDHRTLYLLAKQPFDTERAEAKLSDGEIILLDINARPEADDTPIDIVLPVHQGNRSVSENNVNSDTLNYVSLLRYAIQQLYAPETLLTESSVITRFPMSTRHVVPLLSDDSATVMPMASWRGGDVYVTALFVKNLLHQPLPLDPRLLCGNWKAASFYPQSTLASQGSPLNRDATTVFLISERPFSQAMQSCLNS